MMQSGTFSSHTLAHTWAYMCHPIGHCLAFAQNEAPFGRHFQDLNK